MFSRLISIFLISITSGCVSQSSFEFADPLYVSLDGTALTLRHLDDPENSTICIGHTCIRELAEDIVCDDQDFYCINDPSIKFSIPKEIEDHIPAEYSGKEGEAFWYHNGMNHWVSLWGHSRSRLLGEKYLREAVIWGSKKNVYVIHSFEPEKDFPQTTVLYSPEYGVLGIESAYGGDSGLVYESYLLSGDCGYLAKANSCN